MPAYRRANIPGSTVFLTLITYQRRKLFLNPTNIDSLRQACAIVMAEKPFAMDAAVILPEHIHFLWTLPPDDPDYSYRVGRMKVLFTRALRGANNLPEDVCESRKKHRESDVWQRRFYEHTIRDEVDLRKHLDYLHFNPVKHGLVKCVHDWEYSSFHRGVKRGEYDVKWGCQCGDNNFTPQVASLMNLEMGE
ncbi:REP-associated tyrosine transposase [Chamaesiphon minutus]|uniref:Transposase n=1 Tax=Chamaesiphon minutus (strain ATCC 27169 / PCC 6605) TaxID=1173020 RepID=K9UQZ7_CHAP6|nr:transposase [Chamaesiphon minutus]AFY96674.1 transposase [Chamaesiphon minutus PCC 6605]